MLGGSVEQVREWWNPMNTADRGAVLLLVAVGFMVQGLMWTPLVVMGAHWVQLPANAGMAILSALTTLFYMVYDLTSVGE